MGSGNSRLGETKKADSGLGLDDHLERVRINGVGEGSIGIKNAVELKAMRNQELGISARSRSTSSSQLENAFDQAMPFPSVARKSSIRRTV
jgi:hypothetical protein